MARRPIDGAPAARWSLDPEYERLTGIPWQGWVYDWTTRRYVWARGVKLGKADPINARRGDELLDREKLWRPSRTRDTPAKARQEVIDYLTAHGPKTVNELCEHFEVDDDAMRRWLKAGDLFLVTAMIVRNSRTHNVWGVRGIHKKGETHAGSGE